MRPAQTLLLCLALAVPLFAQNVNLVADRVTAQNALFEEQYESDLRNFPQRATSFGDYRYNDKLADYSLAAIVARNRRTPISSGGSMQSRRPASPIRINSRTIFCCEFFSSASPTSN